MPKIDQMFAFIVEDTPGNEGVVAMLQGNSNVWMPLVGADVARVASLRTRVKFLAAHYNKPIKLVFFKFDRVVEIIEP